MTVLLHQGSRLHIDAIEDTVAYLDDSEEDVGLVLPSEVGDRLV